MGGVCGDAQEAAAGDLDRSKLVWALLSCCCCR
jgi:hypothetical protein